MFQTGHGFKPDQLAPTPVDVDCLVYTVFLLCFMEDHWVSLLIYTFLYIIMHLWKQEISFLM